MTAPKCNICNDVGHVYVEQGFNAIPKVQTCTCQFKKLLVENVNRGWKGLMSAERIDASPLLSHVKNNVWATANFATMRSHVRYVALRQDPSWFFRVATDVDLITSWLSSTFLKRADVFDTDVAINAASVSAKMHSLIDYIDPPDLLIIQLGVKSARNSATPEVLLETLRVRLSIQKPTWVFDQPDIPFNHNHIAFSEEAQILLQEFQRVSLVGKAKPITVFPVAPATKPLTIPDAQVERDIPNRSDIEDQSHDGVDSTALSILNRVGQKAKKKGAR